MTKTAITEAHIGIPAAAISHTYVRLRGAQQADIGVHHAHTDIARVNLTWGRILMSLLKQRKVSSRDSRPPATPWSACRPTSRRATSSPTTGRRSRSTGHDGPPTGSPHAKPSPPTSGAPSAGSRCTCGR